MVLIHTEGASMRDGGSAELGTDNDFYFIVKWGAP